MTNKILATISLARLEELWEMIRDQIKGACASNAWVTFSRFDTQDGERVTWLVRIDPDLREPHPHRLRISYVWQLREQKYPNADKKRVLLVLTVSSDGVMHLALQSRAELIAHTARESKPVKLSWFQRLRALVQTAA